MQFSRSMFIFRLVHVLESEFASGIKDICVDLRMIMLRLAVLDRIRGWFYYVFLSEVIKNAVKAINQ